MLETRKLSLSEKTLLSFYWSTKFFFIIMVVQSRMVVIFSVCAFKVTSELKSEVENTTGIVYLILKSIDSPFINSTINSNMAKHKYITVFMSSHNYCTSFKVKPQQIQIFGTRCYFERTRTTLRKGVHFYWYKPTPLL